MPILTTFLFRHGYKEWENPILHWITGPYIFAVEQLLKVRWFVATLSASALVLVLFALIPKLGTEFLPYLDEGVLWVCANLPEGTALEQSSEYGKRLRKLPSISPTSILRLFRLAATTMAPIPSRPAGSK